MRCSIARDAWNLHGLKKAGHEQTGVARSRLVLQFNTVSPAMTSNVTANLCLNYPQWTRLPIAWESIEIHNCFIAWASIGQHQWHEAYVTCTWCETCTWCVLPTRESTMWIFRFDVYSWSMQEKFFSFFHCVRAVIIREMKLWKLAKIIGLVRNTRTKLPLHFKYRPYQRARDFHSSSLS